MQAGIGHNQGPPWGGGWRVHCWRKARARLMPPAPLEVVRRRVRRAAELGLSYPDYASIVLVTGRDLGAWLLTNSALDDGWGDVRTDVGQRAKASIRCDLLILTRAGGPGHETIRRALELGPDRLAEVGDGSLRAGREAIAGLLKPHRLPPAAVAMIGTDGLERGWADAARLARFLPVERWVAGA